MFYFLAGAASSSTVMCLRFRGCPVVLDIELSVSARYQKTRVLLRARRLLLLLVASPSGGVCGTNSKLHGRRVKQNNDFGPIRTPEHNDFWRPTTAKLPLPGPIRPFPGSNTPACEGFETSIFSF